MALVGEVQCLHAFVDGGGIILHFDVYGSHRVDAGDHANGVAEFLFECHGTVEYVEAVAVVMLLKVDAAPVVV